MTMIKALKSTALRDSKNVGTLNHDQKNPETRKSLHVRYRGVTKLSCGHSESVKGGSR